MRKVQGLQENCFTFIIINTLIKNSSSRADEFSDN